jgi:KaiC/GvpD/RAD55 family RecA-like ATPase
MCAGAEGLGKTMLAGQIGLTMARYGKGVILYSLEISDVMILNRWISVISQIESWKIKHGDLSDIEQSQIADAIHQIEQLNIHIVNDHYLTTSQIRSDIMRRKSSGQDVDYIVIDYSGKLADRPERGQEELDRQAMCIGRVSNIAGSLDVATLLVHTLNAEDKIAGRRGGRYDVDIIGKLTKTPGYGDGPDADRHVTITISKLRDQNSVGVGNEVRLQRQRLYPWFDEEDRQGNLIIQK